MLFEIGFRSAAGAGRAIDAPAATTKDSYCNCSLASGAAQAPPVKPSANAAIRPPAILRIACSPCVVPRAARRARDAMNLATLLQRTRVPGATRPY